MEAGDKTRWGFRIPKRKNQHSFLFVLTRPIVMFMYPAVLLPCFWFGIAYMVHVGITSNISLIFESKPFNFTIIQAGLSFFSGLIGAFTGELFAGPVVDYLATRALKTGKRWVPELRFRAIWLALFMMPVGLIVFGTTIQYVKKWIAPLVGNGICSSLPHFFRCLFAPSSFPIDYVPSFKSFEQLGH